MNFEEVLLSPVRFHRYFFKKKNRYIRQIFKLKETDIRL